MSVPVRSARSIAGLLATLVVAMVPAIGLASPAAAAACSAGTGVTVVVQGGGGSSTSCVAASGITALDALGRAGHSTEGTRRDGPGFVCRIDGFPGADAEKCVVTPPANAYWAIFETTKTPGTWRYSSSGAASLILQAGDWVGFRFGSGAAPSTQPVGPQPAAPAPSSDGSGSGSGTGGGGADADAGSPGGSAAPPSATPGADPSVDPSADPSADVSAPATAAEGRDDETAPTSASASADEGGSPWSILLAALVVAGVGSAAFVVNRRRRSNV